MGESSNRLGRRADRTSGAARRFLALLRPWLAPLGAAAVAALVPYLHRQAARTVSLDVDGRSGRVVTTAATTRLVLAEMGIRVARDDVVAPKVDAALPEGGRVVVRRAPRVTVLADGSATEVTAAGRTLAAVLQAAGVVLDPADSVTVNGQPWSLDARLPAPAGSRAAAREAAERVPVEEMFRGVFSPRVAYAVETGHHPGRGASAGRSASALAAHTTGDDPRAAARRLLAPVLSALRPGERPPGIVGRNVVRVVRSRTVWVVDDGVRTPLAASGETVGQALERAGVRHLPGDRVQPPLDTPLAYAPEITIQRGVPFALDADGLTRELRSGAPTIGAALAAAGVGLAGRDIVDPPAETVVSPGLAIEVTRVRDVLEWREVEIPYQTEAVPDPNRPLDEVAVLQAGVPGLATQRLEVTYHGGRVVDRTVLDETIVREPVAERVAYGTHITWGTVMTEAGPMRYWRKLRTYATSYSASRAGTPRSAPWYGRTRIGEVMRKGIVAVDPRVIPLRTNLYVEGYGLGLAGDTGGGIKRLHIDLGYDDDNYIGWHHYVDVYLLEPAPPPDRMPWVLP